MIKIVFTCPWSNSINAFNNYKKNTSLNKGIWKNIECIHNLNDFDYMIVLDCIDNDLLNKGYNEFMKLIKNIDRIIYFQREHKIYHSCDTWFHIKIAPYLKHYYSYEDYDPNWAGAENIVGHLYNWYVVDDERGVCPEGWHVASDDEFIELEMFLGMTEEEASEDWGNNDRGVNEGSKLASYCSGHPVIDTCWPESVLTSDNEFGSSGFNAYPAGHIYSHWLNSPMEIAAIWTSTQADISSAFQRQIYLFNNRCI